MSKYRNSRRDSKNFEFFSPRVFQIFDSKHGSPEDYSDFFFVFFKLNNYVVQLFGSASVTARFGSFAIFLLLNDSSHDPHFSACQNIETLDRIQKISNFFLSRFSRYSTPNMALQKIILTSFVCFFSSSSSSSRSRAMRSPRHNFSKILSNRNEISQTCSGVNVVVPNTFWVHSVQGCRSWKTSKWKNISRFSPCFFRQSFKHRNFHEYIYLQNPNGWTDFDAQ